VKLNGKWGYIYPDGSTAVPIRYVCERGMAGLFRNGLARIARDGRWRHNRDGEFVTEPHFDMAVVLLISWHILVRIIWHTIFLACPLIQESV
jgi:hypothetical protein